MTHIRNHIERAIDMFGSQAKLAAAINCSQQQISYLLRAKRVSADMALRLDKATGGTISKHVLRPDIFGHCATQTGDAA